VSACGDCAVGRLAPKGAWFPFAAAATIRDTGMYKHAIVHAEDRPARRTAPGIAARTAPAPSIRPEAIRPQTVHPAARTAGARASLALTLLAICATLGALWTYHDLRHPQDSLSPATPLLGIALLVLASRMRRRAR
jgi:hypothetical protein